MECFIDKTKVKDVMKKNNIGTQTELAKKIGMSKNQLSAILSEKNNPIKSNVQLIAEALNISPLDIITDSPQNLETKKVFEQERFFRKICRCVHCNS